MLERLKRLLRRNVPGVEPLGPASSGWLQDASVPEDWRRQWVERGYVVINVSYKGGREIVHTLPQR